MVISVSDYEHDLPKGHNDYNRLQRRVRETLPMIKIQAIRQVYNKYLSLAFAIRETEMRRRRNKTDWRIDEFIHATGSWKINSIMKQNLNWRLVKRSKYGKGVSFSTSASYANKYCNNRNGTDRAFIFCDVLLGLEQNVYDNNDEHPPKHVDTYRSNNGLVLVKFDDFTYNPKFIVYYEDGVYDYDSHRNYTLHTSPQCYIPDERKALFAALLKKIQLTMRQESAEHDDQFYQSTSTPQGEIQPIKRPALTPKGNQPANLPTLSISSQRREVGVVYVGTHSDRIIRGFPHPQNTTPPTSRCKKTLKIIAIFGILTVFFVFGFFLLLLSLN